MTDVAGFGLLGHLLEVTRASGVSAHLGVERLPVLPGVPGLARASHVTGASVRNWASYGHEVALGEIADWQRALLTDPQTSGGLLVSCAPEARDAVMDVFCRQGFGQAAEIGTLTWVRGVAVRGV